MIYSGSKDNTARTLRVKGLYNIGKANTNEGLTLELSALLSVYCDNLNCDYLKTNFIVSLGSLRRKDSRFKIELWGSWSVLRQLHAMLVTSYEIVEVYFGLLGTKSFWTQNERFPAAGSRCRQNLTFENFTPASLGRLRQNICAKKRAARVARVIFPHSTNEIIACVVVVAIAVIVS